MKTDTNGRLVSILSTSFSKPLNVLSLIACNLTGDSIILCTKKIESFCIPTSMTCAQGPKCHWILSAAVHRRDYCCPLYRFYYDGDAMATLVVGSGYWGTNKRRSCKLRTDERIPRRLGDRLGMFSLTMNSPVPASRCTSKVCSVGLRYTYSRRVLFLLSFAEMTSRTTRQSNIHSVMWKPFFFKSPNHRITCFMAVSFPTNEWR